MKARLLLSLCFLCISCLRAPNLTCKEAAMEPYETRPAQYKEIDGRDHFLVCSPNGKIYSIPEE